MIDIGVGYAGLEKFCMIMGMKCLHRKTFVKHSKTVSEATETVADNSLQLASKIVHDAYSNISEADENGIVDISVSYDGSWMKRGHTSNFGVGVVIDLLTGLILDYEAAAAMLIWKRSVAKHGFRYVTLLSDGDSKTFFQLSESSIYGKDHPIMKEECINHVSKRMGTALRKVAKDERLGGRGYGRLTQSTMERLKVYYQRAIQNNLHDVSHMRNAIYATLFHAVSNDEDPHHNFCPGGEDSWCFYNRAAANGETREDVGHTTDKRSWGAATAHL